MPDVNSDFSFKHLDFIFIADGFSAALANVTFFILIIGQVGLIIGTTGFFKGSSSIFYVVQQEVYHRSNVIN